MSTTSGRDRGSVVGGTVEIARPARTPRNEVADPGRGYTNRVERNDDTMTVMLTFLVR